MPYHATENMLRDSLIFILHNLVHSVCEKVYPNFKAECLQRVHFLEYLFFCTVVLSPTIFRAKDIRANAFHCVHRELLGKTSLPCKYFLV